MKVAICRLLLPMALLGAAGWASGQQPAKDVPERSPDAHEPPPEGDHEAARVDKADRDMPDIDSHPVGASPSDPDVPAPPGKKPQPPPKHCCGE